MNNGGMFLRLRFACKLAFAIVLALFLGFHLQLETPRWSVLTAAIVAAGPAFAAGGEPFSGAIRHRGWLRIIGTFIGSIGGLLIMMLFIRAPLVMMLLCCAWAGICTWISSLVRVENSYAFGLAGYTAHQRRDQGTYARPCAAQKHHHQRRTDKQHHDQQTANRADKCPDNT